MTAEQYERWKDFALRMARACCPKKARKYQPDAAWVETCVKVFFDMIDPRDICVITSWDGSDDYPEGHPYYHAEVFTWGTRYAHGPCLGDDFTSFEWERRGDLPLPVKVAERLERLGWSDTDDADEQADAIWDAVVALWYGPVSACIRAGIDLACPDGAGMGVMGYTAGDLRRAYPEGVPAWITGGDGHKWTTHHMQECALGMIPKGVELDGTFAEMADEAEVWL